MTKKRPKLRTPKERFLASTAVIFARSPGVVPKEISEPLHAALAAERAGIKRHSNRKVVHDWPSVVIAIDAAGRGNALRTKPIRAAAISALLSEFSPKHVSAPAFIKWLRRGNLQNM